MEQNNNPFIKENYLICHKKNIAFDIDIAITKLLFLSEMKSCAKPDCTRFRNACSNSKVQTAHWGLIFNHQYLIVFYVCVISIWTCLCFSSVFIVFLVFPAYHDQSHKGEGLHPSHYVPPAILVNSHSQAPHILCICMLVSQIHSENKSQIYELLMSQIHSENKSKVWVGESTSSLHCSQGWNQQDCPALDL